MTKREHGTPPNLRSDDALAWLKGKLAEGREVKAESLRVIKESQEALAEADRATARLGAADRPATSRVPDTKDDQGAAAETMRRLLDR